MVGVKASHSLGRSPAPAGRGLVRIRFSERWDFTFETPEEDPSFAEDTEQVQHVGQLGGEEDLKKFCNSISKD